MNYYNDSVCTVIEGEFLAHCFDVFYFFPYLPVIGTVNYDENNSEHINFKELSKKLYGSKYRNSRSHYYLFESLKPSLKKFSKINSHIDAIVPLPSSNPMVEIFSNKLAEYFPDVPIINCLGKVEKSKFKITDNKWGNFTGNILLIDDIVTSGSAISEAINVLLRNTNLQTEQITILCLGKTERDYNVWDLTKKEVRHQFI